MRRPLRFFGAAAAAFEATAGLAAAGVTGADGSLDAAALAELPVAVRSRVVRAAVLAAGSPAGADSVATRLTTPAFRQLIESRDAHLGALTGVAFAEGVIVREPLLRKTLFDMEDR